MNQPKEYSDALKKVMRMKRLPTVIIIVTVVFVIVFHEGNKIETAPAGALNFGFLGIPATVAVCAAAFIAAVTVHGMAAKRVDRILTEECDPGKFIFVYQKFRSPKRFAKSDPAASLSYLLAYHALGDFESTKKHADDLAGTRYGFRGHYELMKIAFFENDFEVFEDNRALFLDAAERSGKVAALAAPISFSGMMEAEMKGEREEALRLAEKTVNDSGTPHQKTVTAFYLGLVFFREGETGKAKEQFETVLLYGGETFFKSESERILSELNA